MITFCQGTQTFCAFAPEFALEKERHGTKTRTSKKVTKGKKTDISFALIFAIIPDCEDSEQFGYTAQYLINFLVNISI